MYPRPRAWFLISILLLAGAAAGVRLYRLDDRPLHTDEAVQAIKFGHLLEEGYYQYDPHEYHGPSLYYASVLFARLAGIKTLVDLEIRPLRCVPVAFGVGLVLLLLLVSDGMGKSETLWAALFTTLSPAMVYFSRFYIQEMLLVLFTFAALVSLWRYLQSGRFLWAAAAGLSVGLMHATKETCILAYAAMAGAWLIHWTVRHVKHKEPVFTDLATFRPRHHIGALVIAVSISVVLFSSFFTYARGPLDSILSYTHYVGRSVESGHVHPWYYYLSLLGWEGLGSRPAWSEGFILILAVVGVVRAYIGSGPSRGHVLLWRYLVLYTLILMLLYCVIPYKTPWSMLGFVHGLILLAGLGAATLVRACRGRTQRIVAASVLAAGTLHLGVQTARGSYRYHSDTRNPYVYSQTSPDLLRFVERIHDIAAVHPDGKAMEVKIMSPEYWPLPWYLRDMPNVGYWNSLAEEPEAPVIVSAPAWDEELRDQIGEAYQIEFVGLRPGVLLLVYIREDLWELYMAGQTK